MRILLPPRRLIPRWRPISATLKSNDSLSSNNVLPGEFAGDAAAFDRSISAWRRNPTAGHLGDVLAFGVHTEFQDSILAAGQEAVSAYREMTTTQQHLFTSLRQGDSASSLSLIQGDTPDARPFQSRMQDLRKLLSVAPGNPLALLDFAQLKLATGDEKIASKILHGALSLAPRNRVVIRTLARFLRHIGEKGKAHALVVRALRESEDPWLMASEIALADSAEITPRFLQRARRILNERRLNSKHLSELAGAVATIELRHGALKSAREYARLSLLHPNDNVAAQAVFECKAMGISLEGQTVKAAIACASEAALFSDWFDKDLDTLQGHALRWHYEEPFSSRPIQFLSTVFSLQGKYAKAGAWIACGLRADPSDHGLLTTSAFIHAATGKTTAAEKAIHRVRQIAQFTHGPYVTATEGLLALKRGDYQAADFKYREAILTFTNRGQLDIAGLGLAQYARWAIDLNHPKKEALLAEAIALVNKNPSFDALIVLNGDPRLNNLKTSNDKLRLTAQLVLDSEKNILTQTHALTRPGAPGFVIKK